MKKIEIHSDGACEGNPGPGGWAAVLTYGKHRRVVSGGAPATTNNRMEVQAAIEALRALKEPCEVEFHTDSNYLKDGITKWVAGWRRNGWLTREKQPVKNEDLWRQLDGEVRRHKIEWHWLKGHAGHQENEACDQTAKGEITKIRKQFSTAQLKALLKEFSARQKRAGKVGHPSLELEMESAKGL